MSRQDKIDIETLMDSHLADFYSAMHEVVLAKSNDTPAERIAAILLKHQAVAQAVFSVLSAWLENSKIKDLDSMCRVAHDRYNQKNQAEIADLLKPLLNPEVVFHNEAIRAYLTLEGQQIIKDVYQHPEKKYKLKLVHVMPEHRPAFFKACGKEFSNISSVKEESVIANSVSFTASAMWDEDGADLGSFSDHDRPIRRGSVCKLQYGSISVGLFIRLFKNELKIALAGIDLILTDEMLLQAAWSLANSWDTEYADKPFSKITGDVFALDKIFLDMATRIIRTRDLVINVGRALERSQSHGNVRLYCNPPSAKDQRSKSESASPIRPSSRSS